MKGIECMSPGALQDDLADGAGPSRDQQPEAPQPNALEEEAAAAVRPDHDGADCKPPNLTSSCLLWVQISQRRLSKCMKHVPVLVAVCSAHHV